MFLDWYMIQTSFTPLVTYLCLDVICGYWIYLSCRIIWDVEFNWAVGF